MPRYRLTVQYPITSWYEYQIEVEAASEDLELVGAALDKLAREGGCDEAYSCACNVGGDEAGKDEITNVEEV